MEFFGFYFNFSGIFSNLIHLKKGKKGLFNRAGPAKLTWHSTNTWRGHTSHVNACVAPMWREQ